MTAGGVSRRTFLGVTLTVTAAAALDVHRAAPLVPHDELRAIPEPTNVLVTPLGQRPLRPWVSQERVDEADHRFLPLGAGTAVGLGRRD